MTKTKAAPAWHWIRWALLGLGALAALGLAVLAWQRELEPLLVDVEDLQRADLYSRVYTGAVSGGLVIVAALIAFFGVRMNVNEQRAQRLAADTRAFDQLQEQKLRAEQQHTRETLRDLRGRYSAAAEQISSDSTAMQHAGVYGLVALADDWEALGDRAQVQACVDLLCAVARSRTVATEVQDAIMRTIDERVSSNLKRPGQDWSSCMLRLQGISLKSLRIDEWHARLDLSGAQVEHLFASGGSLEGAVFADATLSIAVFRGVNLAEANFEGVTATAINFSPSTEMPRASFVLADIQRSRFRCNILGVNFLFADLRMADLSDVEVFEPINHDKAYWDVRTRWPAGYRPPVADHQPPDEAEERRRARVTG